MKKDDFRKIVHAHYKKHGRVFPWRKKISPYRIVVSEIMLQQTQADRVVPYFQKFLKRFPTWKALAAAPLKAVLTEWQGLGYNRRAKFLHETAKIVTNKYNGKLPSSAEELRSLPGIGEYTAGAIQSFAFDQPSTFIETNIRTVYLHHYFKGKKDVTDKAILNKVRETVDTRNPSEWYAALMDYGTYLKACGLGRNSQSAHYAKQSKFKGSTREIRGNIIKALTTQRRGISVEKLVDISEFPEDMLKKQLEKLLAEGLIRKSPKNGTLSL